MRSFTPVVLFAALFTAGVAAGPYKRGTSQEIPTSVTFSFSGTPTLPSGTGVASSIPTGGQGSGGQIYVCHPVDPSGLLPAPQSGTPNNATLSGIPSGPPPTSVPSVPASPPSTPASAPSVSNLAPSKPASAPPSPTSGQGSGGPIYICRPADSSSPPALNPGTSDTPLSSVPAPAPSSISAPSSLPADAVPTSDAPTVNVPGSATGVLQPTPTDSQGSGGPAYICYPAGPASVSAPVPSIPSNATLTPIPSDPVPTSASSISIQSQ